MADIKNKRLQIESLVYRTMNALDPSGSNTEKYKAMFSKMNILQMGYTIPCRSQG